MGGNYHLYMTIYRFYFGCISRYFYLFTPPYPPCAASGKKDIPAAPSKSDTATVSAINYTDIPHTQIRKVIIFIKSPNSIYSLFKLK